MRKIKGVIIGGGVFAENPEAFAAAGLEITDAPHPGTALSAGHDFAVINLPAKEACATALLALESGINVACEAPFCCSTKDLEALRAAAEKSGRTIFSLQPWERSPALRALEKALDRGLAGEINYASIKATFPAGTHTGMQPLWQVFSILLSSVRRPPYAIEARMPESGPAAFHVHFGGADGFVHLSEGDQPPSLRISVSGSGGSMETDGRLLKLDIPGRERKVVEFSGGWTPGTFRKAWLTAELADFREEISGVRPRGSGLRNTRYCVKLMRNAPYSSSVRSAAVPL